MKTKTLKEKKFYLCDNCKKVGIKSYKVKTFEPFNCPVCKKETTLFLPFKKDSNKDDKKDKVEEKVDEKKMEIKQNTNKDLVTISNKSSISLNFFIFFMIGFIAALFLTKN